MNQSSEKTPVTKRKKALKGCLTVLLVLVVLGLFRWGIRNSVRVGPEFQLWRTWSQVSYPEDRPPKALVEQRSAGDTAVFDGMEFVWCPAGTFKVGSNKLGKFAAQEHELTLAKGFWLGKYELTKAQWVRVMNTKPWRERIYDRRADSTLNERVLKGWTKYGRYYSRLRAGMRHVRSKELGFIRAGMYDPDTPATHVTREDVQQFIETLDNNSTGKYRLPTGHEWEYACRAGTLSGDAQASPEEAWMEGEREFAQSVGKKLANAWGIHDMIGNVSEFATRPSSFGIELRGGGFRSLPELWQLRSYQIPGLDSEYCCAFVVDFIAHPDATDYWGFRLLRETEEVEAEAGDT